MRLEPCALTIGGLDPSGGAGVFADLRAFAAASVWGCGAVAVVTVQSTAGLRSSYPIETKRLLQQVREIARHQHVRGIKIGALGSASNARGIDRWLATLGDAIPIVLDPVLHPTRSPGHVRLLEPGAIPILLGMMKRVTLITPNVPEAESLLGKRIRTLHEAEQAARELVALGARAALVKGGHLPPRASKDATTDVLAIGKRVVHFEARRVEVAFHGTGCALSSLIAGRLARGRVTDDDGLVAAVRWAKGKLRRALARPLRIGDGLSVLDP
jgi:hydroxymethylpyrimidine/phosphomethylpyrimidine kinase